jgi:hypothetical protein
MKSFIRLTPGRTRERRSDDDILPSAFALLPGNRESPEKNNK